MDAVVLDSIINRLLQVSTDSPREYQLRILEAEICELCVVSSKIFLQQPNLLELEAPINVCGDIHGQYSDLLRFFDRGGFPPAGKYLFLGNYAGKGGQSVETMCLLLAYKIRYPDSFFLLRGNHDCESMARMWGFRDECKARFNARLWRLFVACFDCLPAAAIIGGKVICLHGGLSPVLTDLDQIRAMARPADVPPAGLLCDILWSDPSKEVPRWGLKLRGLSYIFGAEVVSEFLHRNGLALLCRSHQVVDDGYEYFAGEKLVTVFSAPSFCGEYMNAGSMMSIDGDLKHSFITLRPPTERRLKFFPRALSKPGASSRVKLAEWKIELFGTSRAGKVRTTPGVKRASSIEMAQGKLYRATNGTRSLPPRNYLRYDQGPVTNVDHSTISIQSLTMTSSSMYSTDNDDDVTLDWDTLSQPMFEEVEEIPSMRYL